MSNQEHQILNHGVLAALRLCVNTMFDQNWDIAQLGSDKRKCFETAFAKLAEYEDSI